MLASLEKLLGSRGADGAPSTTASGDLRLPALMPGSLPGLGHVHHFFRRPLDLLMDGHMRYGDLFRIRLAHKEVAVFVGPKAHQALFHAPEDVLSAREVYQFTVPIFGEGIAYGTEPAIMAEQLGFLHPALSEKRLRVYTDVMVDEVERYIAGWGQAGEFDIYDVMQELTTYIATRCLLGDEIRRHLNTEFTGQYHELQSALNFTGFIFPKAPLPSVRRRDRARNAVAAIISRIVAERRRAGAAAELHQDFLQTLIEARYKDGSALSDDIIAGLLITLIFAGQHTSSVQAAWAGIELHQHRQYLPIIQKELADIYGGGAALTRDTLQRSVWLDRAVKEAERLHPPLIMLFRAALKDFEYNGYSIPKGWWTMVSPAVAHRSPHVFSHPNQYWLERYEPGREEDRKALYTLIGFGGGKHRCVGMVFAYQQIKVIWTLLLQRFEFELLEPAYVPDMSTWVVGPKKPARLRYKRKVAAQVQVPLTA